MGILIELERASYHAPHGKLTIVNWTKKVLYLCHFGHKIAGIAAFGKITMMVKLPIVIEPELSAEEMEPPF